MTKRRDFLLGSLPLGAALLFEANLKAVAAANPEIQERAFDQETYDFWIAQASQPSQTFAEHGRLPSSRGVDLSNEPDFLFYSPDTGFVRAASTSNDTPVSKSLIDKGDTSLLLSIDTIRPSADQMKKMFQQKNGSLRLDLKQGAPLQHLSETLNWSAIASMFPGDQPFSSYHEIAFDPKSTWGQAKKVPFSGGIGFWCWNFSTQVKPSLWSQAMSMLMGKASSALGGISKGSSGGSGSSSGSTTTTKAKAAAKTVLGLGLPSIATTALGAFNTLFGSMFSSGGAKNEWILHSVDTALMATQEARQKHPGHAVALRSGNYVVVEAQQSQQLLSGKYQLKDGMVVPADTKDADLDEAGRTTLPAVSYIALSTVVEPM